MLFVESTLMGYAVEASDGKIGAVRRQVERDRAPQAPRPADDEAARAVQPHAAAPLLARIASTVPFAADPAPV